MVPRMLPAGAAMLPPAMLALQGILTGTASVHAHRAKKTAGISESEVARLQELVIVEVGGLQGTGRCLLSATSSSALRSREASLLHHVCDHHPAACPAEAGNGHTTAMQPASHGSTTHQRAAHIHVAVTLSWQST
jgi:hypothetical protein